jgi:hypothetical protein
LNVNFTQTMLVRCNDLEALIEFAEAWDESQSEADVMGYMGQFILANRAKPGEYLMVGQFGVVDPDVSAADEAMKNNERWEAQGWGKRLRAVIEGEPLYEDYDEVYRTG